MKPLATQEVLGELKMQAKQHISRFAYGELNTNDSSISDFIKSAKSLIAKAVEKKKLPPEYDLMEWQKVNSKKRALFGERRVHEIYDISIDKKKVIVCVRTVEGNKYGQSTTNKDYFLVSTHGTGVKVTEAPKATTAKICKQCLILGQAIRVIQGKESLVAPCQLPRDGVKVVKRDERGELVSVWDNSGWSLGQTRREGATQDHTGGFYFYYDESLAIQAAKNNKVFGDLRPHDSLVLIKVKVRGREFHIGEGKHCATELTPIEVIKNL